MPTVHFSGTLTAYTGGLEQVTIDAPRVHELMLALVERFPGLAAELERVAVAIDGQIYNHADYQKLEPRAEVHLVPPVAGG